MGGLARRQKQWWWKLGRKGDLGGWCGASGRRGVKWSDGTGGGSTVALRDAQRGKERGWAACPSVRSGDLAPRIGRGLAGGATAVRRTGMVSFGM